LKRETNHILRIKETKPTIGFCGALTHPIRFEVINELNKFEDISKNFIIRDHFWGGDIWGDKVRKEYIQNTVNSDFILCMRGAGNFSYRLYETMCLGKIPLIIDTDIDLPFENYLNYEKKILRINFNEISHIPEKIMDYWEKIEDYRELQFDIINFWEDHLSPIGFIKTFNQYKDEISNVLY
jgi:hypothetical protein